VTRLGRRRRWPGWSEGASGGGSAARRAPAPRPRSLARAYAAPQRPWDPGSSECPPERSSPACRPSGKREGDFPALLPAPCEAARARPRPSLWGLGVGREEGEEEGEGRALLAPAGRGGRRRQGRGPCAVRPRLGGGTPGGELPRPPARGGEQRRVSFPPLEASPAVSSALSPGGSAQGRAEGSCGVIGAGLEERWGCWEGRGRLARTGDACFGGVVGSGELKASSPRLELLKEGWAGWVW